MNFQWNIKSLFYVQSEYPYVLNYLSVFVNFPQTCSKRKTLFFIKIMFKENFRFVMFFNNVNVNCDCVRVMLWKWNIFHDDITKFDILIPSISYLTEGLIKSFYSMFPSLRLTMMNSHNEVNMLRICCVYSLY